MRPTVSTGDLALAAHPASAETFAPYGQVLEDGERAYLGRRGRVLLAMDKRRRGPRRVAHLQRYPEARRAYLPAGAVASWIVVLEAGEAPEGPPAAFLLPAGCGVVVGEGVWHAGPVPLEDTTVCELLEAIGAADRFDRRSVKDLTGLAAVRVLLPEEPGAPTLGLDLSAGRAVLLDAALQGRLRLGCLLLEDLAEEPEGDYLDAELARTATGLRAMWGHAADLGEVPGIAAGRELYRDLGLDLERFTPRSEALLGRVLAGQDVAAVAPIEAATRLCALRSLAPLGVYDAGLLGERVTLRLGSGGEGYPAADRGRIALEGRPLLADAEGPFGSLLGDGPRARPGARTRRVLVVLTLPTSSDEAAVGGLLDGIEKAFVTHLGAKAGGRLIVG